MAQIRRRNKTSIAHDVVCIIIFCTIKASLLSLVSCDDKLVYNQNTTLENRNWTYNQQVQFPVQIIDSTLKYTVYLNLRHTKDYEYTNLHILLDEKGSKLDDTTVSRNIPLATSDGRWLGKFAASLYEVEYLLHENYTFPDTGEYLFTIKQNMPSNPLHNIVDIGLKIKGK